MTCFDSHFGASFVAALAIIAGALASEDAATITAGTLAAASVLDARLSFLSAVAGLWVGDLGVYGAVQLWKEKASKPGWLSRAENSLPGAGSGGCGHWPLALSRFFPGTRLPAYISAALNRMPFARYAGVTWLTAVIWTAVVFAAIRAFPAQAQTAGERITLLGFVGLAVFAALAIAGSSVAPTCEETLAKRGALGILAGLVILYTGNGDVCVAWYPVPGNLLADDCQPESEKWRHHRRIEDGNSAPTDEEFARQYRSSLAGSSRAAMRTALPGSNAFWKPREFPSRLS